MPAVLPWIGKIVPEGFPLSRRGAEGRWERGTGGEVPYTITERALIKGSASDPSPRIVISSRARSGGSAL
jgi:hypothetical protein